MRYQFLYTESNSFGDQVLHIFDHYIQGEIVESFPEGDWVDPKEYVRILNHGQRGCK